MTNVIEFPGRTNDAEESPFDGTPLVTVEIFGPNFAPVRIAGQSTAPNDLRIAARRLWQVACVLLDRAYSIDGDVSHLLRFSGLLFHSGRLEVDTFNGSGSEGETTTEDVDWMIRAMPYFKAELVRRTFQDNQKDPGK